MKYLLLFILNLVFITHLHSQTTYAEIGAVGSYCEQYRVNHFVFGGQLTANYQFRNNLLAGIGVQALQFKDDNKGYYPLFARLGYAIPLPGSVISIHADGGYSLYKKRGVDPGDGPTDIRGGLYLSPGISIHGKKRFSPYVDVKYTRYQFVTTGYAIDKHIRNLDAITVSAGLCILHKQR